MYPAIRMFKTASLCLFATLTFLVAAATNEKVISNTKADALPGDSVIVVADTGFYLNPGRVERTWLSQNVVSVYLDENSIYQLQSSFTAKVFVEYTFEDYSSHTSSVITDSFTIKYVSDPDTGGVRPVRDYRVFPDIYKSKVKITRITYDVAWDVKHVIGISNEIAVSREYSWIDCPTYVDTLYNTDPPDENVFSNSFDEVSVGWPPVLGADEYDLEWAWRDSAQGYISSNLYEAAIFSNSATRVSVAGGGYRIPVLYDGPGWVYYRVRPVKILESGQRVEGGWSSSLTRLGLKNFAFMGFQRRMNWQASTSFAEEGKRKSVVSYFDGSLRSRQTVTKDNSSTTIIDGEAEHSTVVAETFYDYQGRAAIQVLPAPSLKNILTYAQNFNRASVNTPEYDKDDYDKVSGGGSCGLAAGSMSASDSGAANYYSPSSGFLTADAAKTFSKYVPDAGGFPFTQTEYSLDNTGRIARQGGVGAQHRLGVHDTRYYYGKPSQPELDMLFGTEAGNASHYYKNMVRDANGQYSVSYTDMHGRTVATALAGVLPDSIKLEKLASNIAFTVTEPVIEPNSQVVDGFSIISTKGITVPVTGLYKIKYELTPEGLQINNCDTVPICYDCLYDLNIKIISDCGDVALTKDFAKVKVDTSVNNSGVDTVCNSLAFSYTDSVTLAEGAYTLTKTLTVRQESLELYRDSIFLAQNTCRDFDSFLQEETDSLLVALDCAASCEECAANVGTWDAFKARYKTKMNISEDQWPDNEAGAMRLYGEAKQACNSLCAADSAMTDNQAIRLEMLNDMTPEYGQYAVAAADPQTGVTIFNTLSGTTRIYQDPSLVYRDMAGKPDTVTNSDGLLVTPHQLTSQEFTDQFKESWAGALLSRHPEKCKLDLAMSWEASYKYDEQLKNTETYADALAKGYFNPPATNPDPALATTLVGGTASFRDAFANRLKAYTLSPVRPEKVSIWTLANRTVRCQGAGDACFDDTYVSNNQGVTVLDVTGLCQGDKDAVWKIFRGLYLQVKAEQLYGKLDSLCPSTAVPSGYTRRFPNPASEGGLGYTVTTSVDDIISQNKEQIDNAVALTCEGYAESWLLNLGACGYDSTQWETLKARLVYICKKGGDIEHITGSSTVRPGESVSFGNSFEEAVRIFNTANSITTSLACNGYLIVTPPPYNSPLTQRANQVVASKPSDTSCLCHNLNKFFEQKQSSGQTGITLGAYLRNTFQISMTDGAVDSLRALCGSSDTSCKYLASPIIVPPAIYACDTLAASCMDCVRMDSLYKAFTVRDFPGKIPVWENNDSAQQAINLAFKRYMNYRTGFSYDHTDYLDFRESCGQYTSDSSCLRLDTIVANFKGQYYRAPRHLYDASTGCDTARWVSNFNGGKLQMARLDQVVQGGIFIPKIDSLQPVSRVSSLDYYDTTCFAPFTFEARVKAPRSGYAYNHYNTSTKFGFEFRLQYEFQGATRQSVFPVDIYADTLKFYYSDSLFAGPVSISGNLSDWRVLRYEVSASRYKVYLDGVLLGDFPHQAFDKFAGFYFSPSSSSFRADWVRMTDQYGQVVLFEDFDKGCASLAQINKDPCKPGCQDAFTAYYNTVGGRNTSYTYLQVDSIAKKSCGRLKELNVCLPSLELSKCAALDTVVSNFKLFYNTAVAAYVPARDYQGYDTLRWHFGHPGTRARLLQSTFFSKPGVWTSDSLYSDGGTNNSYACMHYDIDVPVCDSFSYEFRFRLPKTGTIAPTISDKAWTFYLPVSTWDTVNNYNTFRQFYFIFRMPDGGPATLRVVTRGWDGGDISNVLYSLPVDYQDWVTAKVELTQTQARIFYNGVQLGSQAYGRFKYFEAFYIQPFAPGLQIDWVRIADSKKADILYESFEHPKDLANLESGCRPDCQTAFAGYYNTGGGRSYSYTYAQLDSMSLVDCGSSLNVCGPAPAPTLCGRSNPLFPEAAIAGGEGTPCSDTTDLATSKAIMRYEAYLDSLRNTFDSLYLKKCFNAASLEKMTLTRPSNEYHYTLYYYDQAGNLVKTITPRAVDLFRDSIKTNLGSSNLATGLNVLQGRVAAARAANASIAFKYRMPTNYRYNSLNQVTRQRTPDSDSSAFWYDVLGRLVVSQNAKQAVVSSGNKDYSYTLYDYLGRIMEVGQRKHASGTAMTQVISQSNTSLLAWLNTNATNTVTARKQITRTVYDLPRNFSGTGLSAAWFSQANLRNRVSYSQVIDMDNTTLSSVNQTSTATTYRAATFYTYDIHGNVGKLLQHFNAGVMKSSGDGSSQFKLIRYSYDLISGKVNEVSYQPSYYDNSSGTLVNFPDRFYHQYEYDAENRLVAAYTSHDSVYWEKDAHYDYYRHGPLARMELGHAKVQGIDYAYTLHGWLKGTNSTRLKPEDDMGGDGKDAPSNGGNNVFARDEVGTALYYYLDDYKHTGTSAVSPFAYVGPVAAPPSPMLVDTPYAPMYNGNIMGVLQNIAKLDKPSTYPYPWKTNTENEAVRKVLDSLFFYFAAWYILFIFAIY